MAASRATATEADSTLERAIVRRLGRLHDELFDVDAVDLEASFFAPTGFYLGERVLDSLDIVEMIVALEVDFSVSIVESHEVARYDSIAKLTVLLEEVAGPLECASFARAWDATARQPGNEGPGC